MVGNRAEFANIEKYKTKTFKDIPKTEATKQKWLKIYTDYAQGAFTERQLAEKYNLEPTYVSRVIKWCVFYLNKKTDPKTYRQILLDRLRVRNQTLEKYLKGDERIKPSEIRDITLLMKELRLNDKLIAQVQGILKDGVNIDKSDRRKVVVVTKDLGRRTGAPEPKTIEAKEVEDK